MSRQLEAAASEQSARTSLNHWAYASLAVILVFYAVVTTAMGSAAYSVMHRLSQNHASDATTSIIVNTPSFISGPAIEMALPAGSNLISANVDNNGGNWWYQNADSSHLQVLIAASRVTLRQPAVTDEYFQQVVRIVERSAGDRLTSMSLITDTRVGNYPSRRASYEIVSPSGGLKHAVALLVRREGDDLLIILFGDSSVKSQIDRAATEMFRSLDPRPTPAQYNVHSAGVVWPRLRSDVREIWHAII